MELFFLAIHKVHIVGVCVGGVGGGGGVEDDDKCCYC